MNANLKAIFRTIEAEIDIHKEYEIQHRTTKNGNIEFIITPVEEDYLKDSHAGDGVMLKDVNIDLED